MAIFGERAPSTLLVVLYRLAPQSSSTVKGILEAQANIAEGTRLLLWDNGPVACGMLPEGGRLAMEYVHTPENLPLSVIYNRVLSGLPANGVLAIFDQDSNPDAGYFDAMELALATDNACDLFLPLVRSSSSGVLVSPGSLRWIKGKYWPREKTGIIASKNVTAVASGMVLRASLFAAGDIRFDERLSLYMIDTKFMIDHASVRGHLHVVSHTLRHGDSAEEREPVETKLFRFRNRMLAGNVVFGRPLARNLAYRAYWAWSAIRHALAHRDWRFLRA